MIFIWIKTYFRPQPGIHLYLEKTCHTENAQSTDTIKESLRSDDIQLVSRSLDIITKSSIPDYQVFCTFMILDITA